MLQRIQTLYLLAAEVLTVALLFTKISSFLTAEGQEMILRYNGLFAYANGNAERIVNAWPLAALIVVSLIIGFLVIFLYRHRLFQIRLCFFNMVMNFGVFVLIGYYIYAIAVVGKTTFVFSIVDLFPLVSIFLYYMAYKAIAKDEAMVMASGFRVKKKK